MTFPTVVVRSQRPPAIHADAFQHQQRFHDRWIYRRDEHQVDACLAALLAAIVISPPRGRNNEALLARKVEPQLSRYLTPADELQLQIQQHDIGATSRGDAESREAIVGGAGRVPRATR